jgi:DNA-binding SARP family transcriptional activator
MQVRLLGPVDVMLDGYARPVPGLRRKALLAVLALHRGAIVDANRLIDLVWGAAAAPVANTLQSHLSHLRRNFGIPIVARAPGYALELAKDGTDVDVAERLIRHSQHTTDPTDRARQLQIALALWRGRPLTGIADVAWADEQVHHLDQLWLQAKQSLIEAQLTLGQHNELVADLQRMVQEHPYDERLHGQLMLALYRVGRQADALAIYHRLQHALADGLGIDPAQALRDQHAAMLRQDPSLDLPPPPITVATASTVRDGPARGEHEMGVEAMAADVLALAGTWLQERRGSAAGAIVQARLRHVLALADPESSLALRLRARLVAEADFAAGESAGILAVVEESRTSTDPMARADVLTAAVQCLLGPDDGAVRQALATELIGLSVHTGRDGDVLIGALMTTATMFLEADVRAERGLAELRALASACGHRGVTLAISAIDVTLAVRAGRLADAERMAEQCAREGRQAGHPDAGAWHALHLIMIRWFQGRTPELIPLLEQIVNSPTLTTVDYSYLAALAMARALARDRRGAASALARLNRHGLAKLPRTCNWITIIPGVATAARLLGDVETAAEAYELLLPYAHRPTMAGLGVACWGSVHSTLGTACLTIGDLDKAVEHFREAIRDNEVLAHWPAVALSRRLYAHALAIRGNPQDAATCQRAFAAAVEDARLVGIPLPTTRS